MSIPVAPISHIRELVASLNLDVSHAYEDLAFIESNAFLIQMGKEGKDISVFFNTACTDKDSIVLKLSQKAQEMGFEITWGGTFELEKGEGDTLDIKFFPENN